MSLPPEPGSPGASAAAPVPAAEPQPLSPYEIASATGTVPAGMTAAYPSGTWPTVLANDGPVLGSIARRSAAFFLDFFFTFCVVLVLVIYGFSSSVSLLTDGVFSIFGVPWIAIALNTLGVWLLGGTLAQRMLKLRVVDATTGQGIGLARTLLRTIIIVSPVALIAAATFTPILRYVGYYSNGPSLFWVPGLAWLVMLVVASASGRALHDRAVHSTVIRQR